MLHYLETYLQSPQQNVYSKSPSINDTVLPSIAPLNPPHCSCNAIKLNCTLDTLTCGAISGVTLLYCMWRGSVAAHTGK